MGNQGATLYGRARELAVLAGALDRAARGDSAVVLLTGEPGIGKTALLEHTAARAAARGVTVAWGRAWEVGGAPAHWIWIEALRALLGSPDTDGDAARRVRALVPELGGALSAADPFHLYDAIAELTRALAARAPLLLLFDDLHATDVASLQIALFVARRAAGAPIAVVGSYRDVEARLQPEVEDALARLGRLGEVVSVGRLDAAAVAELVRDALGRDDPELCVSVRDATEGNPLFVRELLRLIQARRAPAGDVPAGVRAVIRQRLALLSPATVALLQAAAVVGRELGVALAAEVAGVTPAALEDAADEAIAAELLAAVSVGRLRFSHALVAETLAADVAPTVRARLHRRAAEALERAHEGDPAAPVAEIAHHWFAAGADAAARAVDAGERAARAAMRRLAFADAAAVLERSLDALAVAAPADAGRRVALMLARCEALARDGQRARAEALCREAAALARELGDPELFARVALALGAELIIGMGDAEVKRLLEEALAGLPDGDAPLRARVMARLAGARQPEPDTAGPIAQAADAIAMARRLGDDGVLLEVLHAGLAAYVDYAPAAERLPLDRETAALARAAGDGPRELRARSRVLFDLVELADVPRFDAELAELDAAVARLALPRYDWLPLMFRAMRADWRGAFADGDALFQRAAAIAADAPFGFAARRLLRELLTDVSPELDDVDAITSAIARMDPALSTIISALADARAGRLEPARTTVRSLRAAGVIAALLDVHGGHFLAELAWYLRDGELAADARRCLDDKRGVPFMLTGIGYLVHGSVDHALMRLAAVERRWDDVDGHARDALALCDRLGARPIAAQVLADWAQIDHERGAAPSAVRQRARDAEAIAAELGMTWLAERCRAFAGPAATAGGPLRVTREAEYWTVEGFGALCRVRDSRGMQMLAQLVAAPGRELHVLELSGADVVDAGDAGELLDDQARAAYEARARDLRAELDDADACNDLGRRERARHELEALGAELSRAFGLGGRARRGGSAVERARSNVRRRIADAMRKIAAASPELGAHLERAVRTGIVCAYEP